MCSELYSGCTQDLLDYCLMKDSHARTASGRCLLEECMLLSGISASSSGVADTQPVPVSSEHSYSMAAAVDYSLSTATVVKTDLDESMFWST